MKTTRPEERSEHQETGSQAPLYTTEILRLAASLREPRRLDRENGMARLRSATCGSRIETTVELDLQGRIQAISQVVLACAFGQAAAALLEQGALGCNRADIAVAVSQIEEWLGGSDQLPSWRGIQALEPARSRKARHGAILLPFRALLAAMEAAASE